MIPPATARIASALCLSLGVLDLAALDLGVAPRVFRGTTAAVQAAAHVPVAKNAPEPPRTESPTARAQPAPGPAPQAAEPTAPVLPAAPIAAAPASAEPAVVATETPRTAPATAPVAAQANGELALRDGEIVAEFETNRTDADDSSALLRVASILRDRRDVIIVLEGHTDARGATDYNERLGLSRATWARDILVRNGVAANRVQIATMGQRRPRGHASGATGADRRVELRVVRRR